MAISLLVLEIFLESSLLSSVSKILRRGLHHTLQNSKIFFLPKVSCTRTNLSMLVEFGHLQKKSRVAFWDISQNLSLKKFSNWLRKKVPLEISSYCKKKSILSIRGKNFKIPIFLNPMWDERGRCNLITDLNSPTSLWLFLKKSFLKVRAKIFLGSLTWKNSQFFDLFKFNAIW